MNNKDDNISVEGIKAFLVFPEFSENIKVFSEIDSTNREAKVLAGNGVPHGSVVIADHQTSGRGRFSRSFFSLEGKGLYISFVLRSDRLQFSDTTVITAYAGLCVCEAIESVCGFVPSIKWVNDVYLNGKKICGILTEGVANPESGGIVDIILGIGINFSIKPDDFPNDIRDRAGSLYPDGFPKVTRNELAAGIIDRILAPGEFCEKDIFMRYKKRLFMLGSDITIIQGNIEYNAKALDINDTGHLIVKKDSGEILTLSSGEISIK